MADLFIFDMDGVLIDSETIIAEVQSAVLAEMGFDYGSHDLHERFVGLTTPNMLGVLADMIGASQVETFVAKAREESQRRLATELRSTQGVMPALDLVQSSQRLSCIASNADQQHISRSLASV